MGSGKSATAIELAHTLDGYSHADTDGLVFQKYGHHFSDLGDLIRTKGMDFFRQCEFQVIEDIVKAPNPTVVALGGGALREENRSLILERDHTLTIWTRVPFELCLKRIKGDRTRPLLDYPLETLRKIYIQREAWYERADIIVDIDPSLSVEDVVEHIQKAMADFTRLF